MDQNKKFIWLLLSFFFIYLCYPLYLKSNVWESLFNKNASVTVSGSFNVVETKGIQRQESQNMRLRPGLLWKKARIKLTADQPGTLKFAFSSADKNNTKRIADFKDIKINGKKIAGKKSVWQAAPFIYDLPADAGQSIDLTFKFRSHHPKKREIDFLILFSVICLSAAAAWPAARFLVRFTWNDQKKGNLLFLIVFFGLCLSAVVNTSDAEVSVQENRTLARLPRLISADGFNTAWSREFDKWLNDHFFMREEMIEKQARLFQKIQQQYKKTWAGLELYVAKNHWIFDFGEMQPVPAYTEAQKERIYQNLQRFGQYFDEKGVRFYFMVVPPKGEIYPEYNIRFLNKSDGIIDLHQYFQKKGGRQFIYLRQALLDAKENDYVFYKTDHHWTHYGALIGYQAFMAEIKKDFPAVPILGQSDFIVEKNKFMKLDPFSIFYAGSSYTRLALRDDRFFDAQYPLFHPKELERTRNTANKRSFDFKNKSGFKKKILFSGNSFSETLQLFFPATFADSRWLEANEEGGLRMDWLTKAVDTYRPDIFVYVIHSNVMNQLLYLY